MWNSFYLFQKSRVSPQNTTFLSFRDRLIQQLLTLDGVTVKDIIKSTKQNMNCNAGQPRPSTSSGPSGSTVEPSESHWPVEMIKSQEGSKKKYTFLKCRHCTSQKSRKETRYMCSLCKIPLCPECMGPWHRIKGV